MIHNKSHDLHPDYGSKSCLNTHSPEQVWIMGEFQESYECGAQWYSNDLNLWQPEFNRIEGMQFWWLNIGLAIGVLPSQAHCCGWQGAVVPDGQATNAPLSESTYSGEY
jgi:hypothetical protein